MACRRTIHLVAAALLCAALIGCSPQDQSILETQVANLGGTAAAEGVRFAQTQGAHLKETAQAELATQGAGLVTSLVAPRPSSKPATPVTNAGLTYTVRPGDTLSAIAQQHNTTVAVLIELNKGQYPTLQTNPNSLQVGWVLNLPGRSPAVTASAFPKPTPLAATLTPSPNPAPFSQTLAPPYGACETSASHTGTVEPGNSKILETGFSSASTSCDASRGVINYQVVVFGSKDGTVLIGADQLADASGHMVIGFTPPFTGKLRVEANLTVNAKTGAAAGSALLMPDWSDILLEILIKNELVKLFIDMTQVLILQTFAGVKTEAYVAVETPLSEQESSVLVGGHGFGASWPTPPNSQDEYFQSKVVTVSITVPVTEGQKVFITPGLRTNAQADGWASASWNLLKKEESVVTSVTLIEERSP